MNTIEKMARAMAKADGKDPDAPAWVRYPGATPFGVCWRDQYLDKARAALEALREPSEGMRTAMMDGYFSVRTYRGDGIFDADQDVLMFRAAIDFALSEAREE